MLKEAKRCVDCKHFPLDCGYWDEKKGIFINGNLGRLKKDAEHNCQDFNKKHIHCPIG